MPPAVPIAAVLAAGLALAAVLLIGSPAGGLGLGISGIFAACASLGLLGWVYAAVALAVIAVAAAGSGPQQNELIASRSVPVLQH